MTALVSLLFIAMIPIDCKIAKFSLHLFVYFFGNNLKIGELTSVTSKERMTTNIILADATQNFIVLHMPITRMLILLPSAMDRIEHEKYLFLSQYENTEDSLMTAGPLQLMSHSEKLKGQLLFIFTLSKCFKQKDSMINTSAITAVTKSYT